MFGLESVLMALLVRFFLKPEAGGRGLNSEWYCNLLLNQIIPDWPNLKEIVFQNDGALSHFALNVCL